MGAFDFMGGANAQGQFQMNPNFLQFLAQMGSGFGSGKGAGAAIGDATSASLRAQAMQGVGGQVFPQLMQSPTPQGTVGPDENVTTIKETADGQTVTRTSKIPSAQNLSTFGTSVPPESMASNSGGVSDQSPFWQALLNLQK